MPHESYNFSGNGSTPFRLRELDSHMWALKWIEEFGDNINFPSFVDIVHGYGGH